MDSKPYAIYRTTKLKSLSALRASIAHTARTIPTPNAQPELTPHNRQLFGFDDKIPNPKEFMRQYEMRIQGVLKKPDAVLLQEVLLSASPQFFSTGDEAQDHINLEEWISASMKWLKYQFSDMLLSVTLHLDERTPHIVGYVLPIAVSKDKKRWLSAKSYFRKWHLAAHQTKYAEFVSHLGIVRGIPGSRATHSRVKTGYGILEEKIVPELAQDITTFRKDLSDVGRLQAEKASAHLLKEFVLMKLNVWLPDLEKVCLWAKASNLYKQQLAAKNATISDQQAALQKLKEANISLQQRSADIDLTLVLPHFGYHCTQSTANRSTWMLGNEVIQVHQNQWSTKSAPQSIPTSVGLVRHLLGCDRAGAESILLNFFDSAAVGAALAAYSQYTHHEPREEGFLDHLQRILIPIGDEGVVLAVDGPAFDFEITSEAAEQARNDAQFYEAQLHEGSSRYLVHLFQPWSEYPHSNNQIICGALAVGPANTTHGIMRFGSLHDAFNFAGNHPSAASRFRLVDSPIAALRWASVDPETCTLCTPRTRLPAQFIDDIALNGKVIELALQSTRASISHSECLTEELNRRQAHPDQLQYADPKMVERMGDQGWYTSTGAFLQRRQHSPAPRKPIINSPQNDVSGP